MSDAALIQVYREHFRFVWRLCRSLGVNAANADDVSHDVFLVVRRRLRDRDERAPLKAWIARIVRNVVMHHHRGSARRHARLQLVSAPPRMPTPDEVLGTRRAAELLQVFVDGLQRDKREVFVLMEIEGMSAPHVAAIVGTKCPTVYTRLRAARREFAAYVAGLSADEHCVPGARRAEH